MDMYHLLHLHHLIPDYIMGIPQDTLASLLKSFLIDLQAHHDHSSSFGGPQQVQEVDFVSRVLVPMDRFGKESSNLVGGICKRLQVDQWSCTVSSSSSKEEHVKEGDLKMMTLLKKAIVVSRVHTEDMSHDYEPDGLASTPSLYKISTATLRKINVS